MSAKQVLDGDGVLLALLLSCRCRAGATGADQDRIVTDLTGPAAQAAKDMVNGLTLYLGEIGSQMAGEGRAGSWKTAGPARVALTKLRKIVEHDRVHLVAGVLSATSATRWPRRWRSTASRRSSPSRLGRSHAALKYRWVIRTGWASSQPPTLRRVRRQDARLSKGPVVASIRVRWEVVGGFQRTFEESGGR